MTQLKILFYLVFIQIQVSAGEGTIITLRYLLLNGFREYPSIIPGI